MIDRCERYFRELDAMLAELVALAGPEATVVLASDHGFGPTRDVFHVNSWLEREGYLTWAPDDAGAEQRPVTDVGFAEMTRHVHALDWEPHGGLRRDARAARASRSSGPSRAPTRRCPRTRAAR